MFSSEENIQILHWAAFMYSSFVLLWEKNASLVVSISDVMSDKELLSGKWKADLWKSIFLEIEADLHIWQWKEYSTWKEENIAIPFIWD